MTLAACALAALASSSAAALQRPVVGDRLPVLDYRYVVPQEGQRQAIAGLFRQLYSYEQGSFPDRKMVGYEEVYKRPPYAFAVFFEFEDMRAEGDSRAAVLGDEHGVAVFERICELSVPAGSTRSLLFPVGGRLGSDTEHSCRVITKRRMHPARRAAARRRARELVEHLNATYEGVSACAYTQDIEGSTDLYFFVDYVTLRGRDGERPAASWEAVRRTLLDDDRYLELTERLSEVLVDEELWEVATVLVS